MNILYNTKIALFTNPKCIWMQERMDLEDEGGCRTREIRERSDLFKEGCTLYSTSGFRTGGKREEGKRLLFLFIFEYRIR